MTPFTSKSLRLLTLLVVAGLLLAIATARTRALSGEGLPESQQLFPLASPEFAAIGFIPFLDIDPTPTPTPTPTPIPTPTVPPEPSWLIYLNQFRSHVGLHPLVENESWSSSDWLHSRYMVKNDYVGHSEDPGNPWYTDEGYTAAQSGNVYVASWSNTAEERPIDFWMTAPFHAISMIDPQLHSTGYAIYREAIGYWQTGATLDVKRGRGELPTGTTFPIPYPAPGGQIWLTTYYGGEFPDPLTSCPGYSPPTGAPIMLQLGDGSLTPQVLSHRLLENGQEVASCRYDETDYYNPSSSMQWTGRVVLNNRDAVVIMPRDPLVGGRSYTVEVVTASGTVTWSFGVTPDADHQLESEMPYEQMASLAPVD